MSNKLNILEARKEELEKRIEFCEKAKKQIIDLVQKILLQLQNKKITLEEYKEKLNKYLENKTAQEWISYYDNQTAQTNLHLSICKKGIKKAKIKKVLKVAIPIIILGIISLLLIIYLQSQKQIYLSPINSEIISNYSIWKYNDANIDLPDAWITQAFDDTSWSQGYAKLGFGTNDGLFNTTLQDLNQITFYFRKNFTIENVSAIQAINLSIDYDDCYAIYINGNLLATSPNFGGTGHTTACTSTHNSAQDGSGTTSPIWPIIQFTPAQINWLQNDSGNIIAVEIHQQATTSSDVVMILNMQAVITRPPTPPQINIISPKNGSTIEDTTPTVNFTINELSEVLYSIDNGQNKSFCDQCDKGYFYLNLEEGEHNLTIYANNSDKILNYNSSTFTIDMNKHFFDSYNDNSSLDDINNITWQQERVSIGPAQTGGEIKILYFRENGASANLTEDSYVSLSSPGSNFGAATALLIDGQNPHAHALIKFPNIFGNNPDQIPFGSEIIEANLTLNCIDPGNNQNVNLLLENWTESQVSWNNRLTTTPWISPGAENPPSRDSFYTEILTCPTTGIRVLNTTYFLRNWSAGGNNYGIILRETGTNGVDYSSSEAVLVNRPLLAVKYRTPIQLLPNAGNFTSTFINTTSNITSIDSIKWAESNTNINNNITVQIFNGIEWNTVNNGDSIQGLNFRTLAYRALFSVQAQTIFLEDINITWTSADIKPPIITIISPQNTIYNETKIDFNLTLNEIGDSCLYSLNNGITNITMSSIDNLNFNAANSSIAEGQYIAIFYCNDTSGNLAVNSASFSIDIPYPLVSFWQGTAQDGATIPAEWIYIDLEIIEKNIKNISFNLYDTNSLLNQSWTEYYYGFDLIKYFRVINNSDLTIDVDTSSVAYNPATNTLFVIHNTGNNENIDELDLTGGFIREITLQGFQDTEGIAYINSSGNTHRFAIVEERRGTLSHIWITDSTTSINTASAVTYDLGLGTFPGNNGIEGVTYDNKRDLYYISKEKTPMEIYRANISSSPVSTTPVFNAESVFSGSQGTRFTDISDLYYDNNTEFLFILSHESQHVAQVMLNGTILTNLSVNHMSQPEGITFDKIGENLYIVGEPDFLSTWKTQAFHSRQNFTSLLVGTYFYNATVFNKEGNSNSTETRSIILKPSINTPAVITDLSEILPQSVTESGITYITFSVLATDINGVNDINDTSINASFSKFGEDTRTNSSCNYISDINTTTANYSCTIGVWYWDGAGIWNVTASILDNNNAASLYYNESFTLLESTCIITAPVSLAWSTIFPGELNKLSDNNPLTINNTCNADISNGGIKLTAINLLGIPDSSYNLPAKNFTVSTTNSCDTGTVMMNGISVPITGAVLPSGNNSANQGIEELYLCLEEMPNNIIAQIYSTAGGGPWEISILVAAISLKRKKKKKKYLEKDNLLETLDSELKEKYGLGIKEILIKIKREKQITYKSEKIMIPIDVFRQEISAAESLCKYLKENIGLKLNEIAELLNRDQRTIWNNYNNAVKKKKEKIIIREKENIPIEIFSDRRFSILESLVYHLKQKGIRNIELSRLINKDPRNIYTLYSRAMLKIRKKTNE